jgi:hypothetical protein
MREAGQFKAFTPPSVLFIAFSRGRRAKTAGKPIPGRAPSLSSKAFPCMSFISWRLAP